MKKPPDTEIIRDIATELGVEPPFIEKDWYAVEVLKVISQIADGTFTPVFSGGTSLSKGYGLIERFSEDLDFKIASSSKVSNGDLKTYREKILQALRDAGFSIIEDSLMVRDNRRFFSFSIDYPKRFEAHASLRPHVKLEFRFQEPFLAPESREIRTFETLLRKGAADTQLPCIIPVETAADKLSAFIWRVLARDRSANNDDPALIRHLHDLAKLKDVIEENKGNFIEVAQKAYEIDTKDRVDNAMPATLGEAVSALIDALEKDPLYKGEYEKFVLDVSYATEDKRIGYPAALESLKNIRKILA